MYRTILHSLICCVVILWSMTSRGQAGLTAFGGDYSGSGGTVSFSVGQVAYAQHNENDWDFAQGVQHAFGESALGFSPPLSHFFKVYPNPFRNHLFLEQNGYSKVSVRLTDIQGRTLRNFPIDFSQTRLDLSNIASGAYLLTLMVNEYSVQTLKVIKQL